MTSYVPVIKNGANGAIFYVGLAPRTGSGTFQSTPTLASGDVKISIDGGALADLATLPVVTPGSSKLVKVTLSQAETNGDNLAIIFSDQAGAEWCDKVVNLQTTARRIDDLAFPATSGRSIVVDAAGLVDANAVKVGPSGSGTAQAAGDIYSKVSGLTFTGAGKVDASVRDWVGDTIPARNVAGVPLIDLKYVLGTISPAAAGAVRADAVTGAVGSVTGAVGSVTGNVGGNVVGSVASVVGAVGSVTGAVGSVAGNVGGNVVGSVASVTGAVGSVTGLTASNLDVAVSTRLASASYTSPDNTSVAAIKTKTDSLTFTATGVLDANVVDWKGSAAPAMTGDAYALLNTAAGEPGQGAPPASASPITKITYLYKGWRNKKTQTATTFDLFNDAGSVVDQKSTVSDDGTTATRGLVVSGP